MKSRVPKSHDCHLAPSIQLPCFWFNDKPPVVETRRRRTRGFVGLWKRCCIAVSYHEATVPWMDGHAFILRWGLYSGFFITHVLLEDHRATDCVLEKPGLRGHRSWSNSRRASLDQPPTLAILKVRASSMFLKLYHLFNPAATQFDVTQ